MLNFEKLLEEIGEFGNYQKYAIILLQARFEYFTSSARWYISVRLVIIRLTNCTFVRSLLVLKWTI